MHLWGEPELLQITLDQIDNTLMHLNACMLFSADCV